MKQNGKSKDSYSYSQIIPHKHLNLKKLLNATKPFMPFKSREKLISSLPIIKKITSQEIQNINAFLLTSMNEDISRMRNKPIEIGMFKKTADDLKKSIDSTLQLYSKSNSQQRKLYKIKLDPELSYTKKVVKQIVVDYRRLKLQ